jgi:sugar phosphate isomerase/epimerase
LKGKEEMKAKISVGSSAFAIGAYERHPIPLETVLQRLVELGFDGVELFGAKPYGHPSDFPTKTDRRNFRRRLDDLGLIPSCYGADLWGFPLGAGKSQASHYEDAFKRNLEFCVDIGCDSIRVDTVSEPPLPDDTPYEDAWRRVVGTWQNCSSWAREVQIILYWEFEPGFMFNKPSEIVRLVDEIAAPNFKLMFDTCHAQMACVRGARQADPLETIPTVEDLVKLLGSRIGTVHLIDSDNTLHDNKTSTHAPFGEGVLNFDRILGALQEVGYQGPWWTIDFCFWPTAWDRLKEATDFVVELLERHHLR